MRRERCCSLPERLRVGRTCSFVFSRCPPPDGWLAGLLVIPPGELGGPGPDSPGRTGDLLSTDVELLVEHERGSAEDDVVIAEAGGPQRQVLTDLRHGAGGDGVDGRLAERLGGDRIRTRQDHVADVERAQYGGEGGSQPLARVAQDLDLTLATGGAESPAEQRGGDLGLEAAALAAGAERAVGVDDDVADLAGRRARAAVEGPVEHETDTDTLVDADHQEVRRVGHS